MAIRPPRRRVVIVDDNRGFRLAAEAFVRALPGVEVAGVADSGARGLEVVEREAPDAVIVDIAMPDISGLEVASQLRRRPARPGIILVSLHLDGATRSEGYRSGADAVVAKADLVDELPQVLEAVFLDRADRGQP